ncbi:hypothetical protein GXM_04483 [Nostoc sphaeroides CCNUC1]|uniref:Uncharacterized protein n=1 Tax=Nostoc sphaeroides CCNUC1 TaxID=2653204 RepID=A0A5P8W2X4_9NOSO|nr:hypothetical protein GXM_04483 [Nostoc sphaeroides CCNUC1]
MLPLYLIRDRRDRGAGGRKKANWGLSKSNGILRKQKLLLLAENTKIRKQTGV